MQNTFAQQAVRHDIKYEDLKPVGWYCKPKYGYADGAGSKWCSGRGIPTTEVSNWGNCAKYQTCAHSSSEVFVICCEKRMNEILEDCHGSSTQGRTNEWRPLTGVIPDCGGIYNSGDAEVENAIYEAGLGYIGQWASVSATAEFKLFGCSNRNKYSLVISYALLGTTRGLALWVNNVVQHNEIVFPSTGGWQKFEEITVDLDVAKGDNSIKFMSIGSGGPNLKRIQVIAPLSDRLIDVPNWMDNNCNDEDRYALYREPTCEDSTTSQCWVY